jgi:hypothetical protein
MPVYNHYYPDANNQINTPGSAFRLTTEGPTVPVAVGLTAQHMDVLQRLGQPIPNPISGFALIDTGASVCMLDDSIVNQLSIPPLGTRQIHSPAGPTQQYTYPASLSFPGTTLPNIAFSDFISGPLLPTGIIALIGRNVLSSFVLNYNGPGGHISLSH